MASRGAQLCVCCDCPACPITHMADTQEPGWSLAILAPGWAPTFLIPTASSKAGLRFFSVVSTPAADIIVVLCSLCEDQALAGALMDGSLGLGLQCGEEEEDLGEASTHAALALTSGQPAVMARPAQSVVSHCSLHSQSHFLVFMMEKSLALQQLLCCKQSIMTGGERKTNSRHFEVWLL